MRTSYKTKKLYDVEAVDKLKNIITLYYLTSNSQGCSLSPGCTIIFNYAGLEVLGTMPASKVHIVYLACSDMLIADALTMLIDYSLEKSVARKILESKHQSISFTLRWC